MLTLCTYYNYLCMYMIIPPRVCNNHVDVCWPMHYCIFTGMEGGALKIHHLTLFHQSTYGHYMPHPLPTPRSVGIRTYTGNGGRGLCWSTSLYIPIVRELLARLEIILEPCSFTSEFYRAEDN